MDLLTSGQKEEVGNVFEHLHDTFKRPIYSHKDAEITILSEDPNYSSLYGRQINSATRPKTLQKQSFFARILYQKPEIKASNLGGDSSLKILLPNADVRLKVDEEAKDYIKDSKRIEINNELYEIVSYPQPLGPFSYNYYIIHLNKII